jgi:hypothetical protein
VDLRAPKPTSPKFGLRNPLRMGVEEGKNVDLVESEQHVREEYPCYHLLD